MDKYNEKYFSPQIGSTELEKTKESVAKKNTITNVSYHL